MIKTYRKTATIKAEQFDGSDEMIFKYAINNISKVTSAIDDHGEYYKGYFINAMELKVGDWIATGANGEYWPITDDVFQQTYAELPMIPHNVWIYIQLAQLHDIPIGHAIMSAESLDNDVFNWIIDNSNVFARAYLDDYQVEGE